MQINKPSGELCSKLRHVQPLLLPPTYSLAVERCYQNKGWGHYFKSSPRQQKAKARQPQVIRVVCGLNRSFTPRSCFFWGSIYQDACKEKWDSVTSRATGWLEGKVWLIQGAQSLTRSFDVKDYGFLLFKGPMCGVSSHKNNILILHPPCQIFWYLLRQDISAIPLLNSSTA